MIIGLSGVLACVIAHQEPSPEMDRRVRAIVGEVRGKTYLFARNLKTGSSYGIHADLPVRTASTIKLPVFVALHEEVRVGRLKWDEKLVLHEKSKVSGSGVLHELGSGLSLTVRDAARLMIVVSDNTATNLVLDRVGADVVNGHLESWGFKQTRLMRKIGGGGESKAFSMPDNKRPDGSTFGIGRSTAREMVDILSQLDAGTLVGKEESQEILKVLGRQQFRDGLARNNMKVRLASKPGALDRLQAEVGIVSTPKAKLAIAVVVDDIPETNWSVDNPALVMMGSITSVLLDGLANER